MSKAVSFLKADLDYITILHVPGIEEKAVIPLFERGIFYFYQILGSYLHCNGDRDKFFPEGKDIEGVVMNEVYNMVRRKFKILNAHWGIKMGKSYL
jgi:hypothetical protein